MMKSTAKPCGASEVVNTQMYIEGGQALILWGEGTAMLYRDTDRAH